MQIYKIIRIYEKKAHHIGTYLLTDNGKDGIKADSGSGNRKYTAD